MRLSPKDMRAVLSLALTKLRFWHIARERSGFDHIEFSSHINVKTYCRNNKKAVRGNKFFVTLSSLSEINTATDRREERRGVERAGVSSYRCCVRFPSLITSSGHLSLSALSPSLPHLSTPPNSFKRSGSLFPSPPGADLFLSIYGSKFVNKKFCLILVQSMPCI